MPQTIKELNDKLNSFPRANLALVPTPLHPLPSLAQKLKLPSLLMKRDDLQGIGGGGNKLRKLEFLAGDALSLGADILVTSGALQSNHARATAAVAAHLGLRCELLLVDRVPRTLEAYRTSGNRVLIELFGANTNIYPANSNMQTEQENYCEDLIKKGFKPYLIPFGGSNWLGSLGYITMVQELYEQLSQSDESITIVCACGSGGMLAGILAGIAALDLSWNVIAISVLAVKADMQPLVKNLTTEILSKLDMVDKAIPKWKIYDKWVGPEYGIPGKKTHAVISTVGKTEGIALDPVYTGKAMEGLFGLVQSRAEALQKNTTVFVHSGGQYGLFAYPDLFTGAWHDR